MSAGPLAREHRFAADSGLMRIRQDMADLLLTLRRMRWEAIEDCRRRVHPDPYAQGAAGALLSASKAALTFARIHCR